MQIKNRIRWFLRDRVGIEVSKTKSLAESVWAGLLQARDFSVGRAGDSEAEFVKFCARHTSQSCAQLMQDLFVLFTLKEKRSGFFVEFGAADGMELSNTYLLETGYGWKGLVAEPARGWHEALLRNRQCMIDTRCVSGKSGQTVVFNEAEDKVLSTIDRYSSGDFHAARRASGKRYDVTTITLDDLLTEVGAPSQFDYLSADTEGSEFEILSKLNFDRYRPAIITVEHNYDKIARSNLYNLLVSKGYQRQFTKFSRFDDWYIST